MNDNTSERFFGTVKFFRQERQNGGYGFCVRDGSKGDKNSDDFFHVRDLMASGVNPEAIEDGKTCMSYRLEKDRKYQKLKAVDIKILD